MCLVFFHMVRSGAYWHRIHDIHACAFTVQTKKSVISLEFERHFKTFIINAEKPEFYS